MRPRSFEGKSNGRVALNESCAPLPIQRADMADRAVEIPEPLSYAILFAVHSVWRASSPFLPNWFLGPEG
jgi:hypothetical protein